MILWETGAGWCSFQGLLGFCLLVPFFDGKMESKTIQLPSISRFPAQPETALQQFKIMFKSDLDTQSRRLIETECTACIAHTFNPDSYLSYNSGWVEHDSLSSVYATPSDNNKLKT